MIKYCIFDLDGTLLNTLDTITYYVNSTLEAEGLGTVSRDDCRRFVGNGARLLISRALDAVGVTDEETFDRVFARYNAAYDASPMYLTAPYEGILQMVDALRNAGVKLGVVSNKPDFATVSVVRTIFGESFEFVRGGRDGVPLKPAPDAPLALLGDMGGSAVECAFVGDTSVDILTAKNMGCALSVGVLWGFRDRNDLLGAGADKIVDNAAELTSVILSHRQ